MYNRKEKDDKETNQPMENVKLIESVKNINKPKLNKKIKNKTKNKFLKMTYDKQSNSENAILLNNSYFLQPKMSCKENFKEEKKEEKKVISKQVGKVPEKLEEKNKRNNFKKDKKESNLLIENVELIESMKNINKPKLNKNIKNKTKNKVLKTLVVVPVIILLALIVAKTLAVKGKSNTGVPNNNKDDEKVNPSIEPEKDKDDEKMNPSTNPESDNQKPKQNNQEEEPSVVPSNILKATGATVTAGTFAGSGAYLVNKVLKSGKPSEVKNSRNVDNKYMYLDSDGKEVIKTEEEQEEILERSALSNDTESTSDEEKNKD